MREQSESEYIRTQIARIDTIIDQASARLERLTTVAELRAVLMRPFETRTPEERGLVEVVALFGLMLWDRREIEMLLGVIE